MVIHCTGCKDTRYKDEHSDEYIGMLVEGLLVEIHGDAYEVCSRCSTKRDPIPFRPRSVNQEGARYQQLISEQRRAHPELSLKKAVQAAGKIFHDPRFEPNPGFREFLLRTDR